MSVVTNVVMNVCAATTYPRDFAISYIYIEFLAFHRLTSMNRTKRAPSSSNLGSAIGLAPSQQARMLQNNAQTTNSGP